MMPDQSFYIKKWLIKGKTKTSESKATTREMQNLHNEKLHGPLPSYSNTSEVTAEWT